jgi:hypothetical protein
MTNKELLLNTHITPVYIATNNIMYIVTRVTFNEVYPRLQQIYNTIFEVTKIIFYTLKFILQQLFKEIYDYFYNNPLTSEKIVLIFIIYSLLLLLIGLNKSNKQFKEQNEKINSLQKQIKLIQSIKNDAIDILLDEIPISMKQTNMKFLTLYKRSKKIEKEIKSFE